MSEQEILQEQYGIVNQSIFYLILDRKSVV